MTETTAPSIPTFFHRFTIARRSAGPRPNGDSVAAATGRASGERREIFTDALAMLPLL